MSPVASSRSLTRLVLTCGACVLMALGGCASTADRAGKAPVATPTPSKADPWENWNRKVYSFNEAVDRAVLRPVATAYAKVVPQPVRTGVSNFYGNFADLWSAVNSVLQGKLADGMQDFMRVGTNTVFGIGGLFDIATEVGLERHGEDFGQTLGRWGAPSGPYIVWPFMGPSTVRETLALPLDRSASPGWAFSDDATRYFLIGLGLTNERANLLPTTRMLDDMALDKYSFMRDAYLQRRRSLVYDGNEPEPEDTAPLVAPSEPELAPAAAAPAASQPTP